jgi:hypothetical protein
MLSRNHLLERLWVLAQQPRETLAQEKKRLRKIMKQLIKESLPTDLPPDLVRHAEQELWAPVDYLRPPARARYDLPELIEIAQLVADGSSARAAAGVVAEQIGGRPGVRHANKKRLYERFRKDREIYLQIAKSPDVDARIAEIVDKAVRQRLISRMPVAERHKYPYLFCCDSKGGGPQNYKVTNSMMGALSLSIARSR